MCWHELMLKKGRNFLQYDANNWLKKHGIYNCKIFKRILAILIKIDFDSINSITVSHQCANIFTSAYLYKVQLCGDSIKRDLYNRKHVFHHSKSILSPIIIYKRHPLSVRMPILKYANANEETADYILNEMEREGYEKPFKVADHTLLKKGLNILKSCDHGLQAEQKLDEYLREKEGIGIRTGIVHGDFHRRNIMYRAKRPVLIDFDCARDCDIQAIDALYYILEEVRYKRGYRRSWLEEWLYIFENTDVVYDFKLMKHVDIDLKFGLILLLLERMAQDDQVTGLFVKENFDIIRKINQRLYHL